MSRRSRLPGLVLLLAAVLVLVLRLGGVPFDATPLLVGLAVLAATAVGPRPRSWAGGAVVTAWGAGVLLTRSGVLFPGREAAVFLVAVGIGLLVGALVTPPERARQGWVAAAAAVLGGGVLFVLAFDLPVLRQAWPWAAGLGAAGLRELARAPRRH